jgi:hypothetical protein
VRGGGKRRPMCTLLFLFGLLLDLIVDLEDEDNAFLRSVGEILPKDTHHGITSQKIALFILIRLFLVSDICEQEM